MPLRQKTLKGSLLLGCVITEPHGFFEEWQLQTLRHRVSPSLIYRGSKGQLKGISHRNGKAKGNFIVIQLKLQRGMPWALFGTTTEGGLVSISEQNTTRTNQVTSLAETLLPCSTCTFAGFSATFCCCCCWRTQP